LRTGRERDRQALIKSGLGGSAAAAANMAPSIPPPKPPIDS
jgi:hypothetical protein